MKLLPDWRAVLTRAWSIRLMLAAGILSGLDVFLQVVVGLKPSLPLAALSGLATCAALVARLFAQDNLKE